MTIQFWLFERRVKPLANSCAQLFEISTSSGKQKGTKATTRIFKMNIGRQNTITIKVNI